MERTVSQWIWAAMLAGLCATGTAWADVAKDQYAVAAGHYANGRWQMTVDEFAAFLTRHADHPWRDRATFYRGEALVQLRKFDEARAQFQKLLADHPHSELSRRALFRSGESAYLGGRHDQAAGDLERFSRRYPDDALTAYALPYLAEIAQAKGDAQAAEKQFAHALEKFPDGPLRDDCRLGIARAWQKQGRREDAHRALQELANDPSSRLADQSLFELGRSHYQAQRLAEANETWAQLAERFPESRWRRKADLGRGWLLYRQQRYDEAASTFEALLEDENPADVRMEAQYRLGMVRRAQANWDEAAKLLTAASSTVKQHTRLPEIHFYAGDSHLMAGNHEQAAVAFDRALDLDRNGKWADDAVLGKIRVAAASKDYAKVDAACQRFRDQFPESSLQLDVAATQATALVALGRYQEAIEPLSRYVTDGPGEARIANCRAELAICYAHLKEFDKAKEAYHQLREKYRQHKVFLPTTQHLAKVAFADGHRTWSEELFKELSSGEATGIAAAEGLAGLAWSQLEAEDLHQSAATFERLLQDHPNDERVAEAALARGRILERLDKLEPALAMYRLVVERHSVSTEYAAALLGAARVHDRLQHDEEAETLYRQLLEEQPNFEARDAAVYGWAWVLKEQGKLEEAEAKFRILHEEFRESQHWPEATYLLADRAAAAKRFDEASGLLDEVLGRSQAAEQDPKTQANDVLARSLYLKGRIALGREDWDAVEAPMSKLIADYPESPLRLPALYWTAEAKFRVGDYAEAGEKLAVLADQTQGRTESWLAMVALRQAQILAHDKMWTDALETAESIAGRFPKFNQQYEVDYLIGRCRAARGEMEAARQAYQRVVRGATGSKTETAAMAQWMIGETYMHQEAYEQARREYLRTETLYAFPEWQARSLLQAGKCYELQGEWQQAVELYAELKKKYPNCECIEEAERRLHVAQQRANRNG